MTHQLLDIIEAAAKDAWRDVVINGVNHTMDLSISYEYRDTVTPKNVLKLVRALRLAMDELEQFRPKWCAHNESDPNYKPSGDSYGWCNTCALSVAKEEDHARDAIAAINKILEE